MAGWDKRLLWGVAFLLAGSAGQRVIYPPPVCGLRGSTVTLPCSFTPNSTVIQDGRVLPIKIIRVRWCQNHEICQGKTPSVYDSDPTQENSSPRNNDPRYRYLGDKRSSCTLQIRDLQREDEATLRFRMEADQPKGHFTERSGVNVTVVDAVRMRIRSSRGEAELTEGENITLSCTSVCSFKQLEVTWFRNDHSLSESGPALSLSALTAKHSGSYCCALKINNRTRSLPYNLKVKNRGQQSDVPLVVGVVCVLLLVLFVLCVLLFFIQRRCCAEKEQRTVGGQVDTEDADNVYSNVLLTSDPQGDPQGDPQDTSPAVEDVSYASIQFTYQNRDRALQQVEQVEQVEQVQQVQQVQQVEDSVIYSSVVSRG